jgi:hypothetical protein
MKCGERNILFNNDNIPRGVDGRIMLGWIFKRWDVGVRTGLGWLRIGIGGGRL